MSQSKAKFIKPPNHLKAKAGGGGIPEERLQQAQTFINDNKTDFTPVAKDLIAQLENASDEALRDIEKNQPVTKDSMVIPAMQIKASGGLFGYQLLTDVADICLQFMEAVNEYNAETIEIVNAHENAMNIIINNELRGSGGKQGYALVQELHKACKRYFKKYDV